MNLDDVELCESAVVHFNKLVHEKEFKKTSGYAELCEKLCEEEWKELIDAKNDIEKLDACADIFVVHIQALSCIYLDKELLHKYLNQLGYVIEYCKLKKYDLKGAILEVCSSNLTKIPLLSDVVDMYGYDWEESACDWIETNRNQNGVYSEVIEVNTEQRVRFKNSEGKLVKWFGYREPRIIGFVPITGELVLENLSKEDREWIKSRFDEYKDKVNLKKEDRKRFLDIVRENP